MGLFHRGKKNNDDEPDSVQTNSFSDIMNGLQYAVNCAQDTLQNHHEARRPGDIAECYADPTKARNELGWVAEYGIEEMCADSWNWQKKNPDGYHTAN